MSNKFLDDPTTFNNGNMIGPDGSASSRVLPNDDAIRDGVRESIVSTVIFSGHSTAVSYTHLTLPTNREV